MTLEDSLVPSRSTLVPTVLYLMIFANSMGKAAMGVDIPFQLTAVGASPIIVGLVQTFLAAQGVKATITAGLLSDRIGRKEVGVPFHALTAALQGAVLLAPSLWQLVPIQALYYSFSMGARAAFVVLLADVVEQGELPVALGYLTAADQGGQLIGCALSGTFGGCGYPCVALASSIAILVTLVMGIVALPRKRSDAAGMEEALIGGLAGDEPLEEDEPLFKVFLGFMQNRRFRQIWTLHVSISFGYVMFSSCLALFCHDVYGYTSAALGEVSAQARVFAFLIQFFLMRWILGFLSESSSVVVGVLGRLAGAAVLAAWISPLAPLTSLSLASIGTAVLEPCLMALAIAATPATSRGVALSVYKVASLIGESLGPLAGGSMYSGQHSLPFWGSAAVMGVAALGMLWSDRCQRLAGEEMAPTDDMETTHQMMARTMSTKGRRKTAAEYMLLADAQMQPVVGHFSSLLPGPRQGGPRRQTAPDMDVGRRKFSVWQPRAKNKSKSWFI